MIEKVGDRFVAKVDLGDGSPIQSFFGDSPEEVTEKLIEAQKNATRKIREQKRALALKKPDPPAQVPDFKGRQLTAQEAADLSSRMLTEAPEAIERVIEARFGASIDTIRQSLQEMTVNSEVQRMRAEAAEFISETPTYKPTPQNEALLLEYLKSHNMGVTKDNLISAFDALGDLIEKKSALEGTPSRVTTRTAVVATSTGRTAQAPPKKASRWTAADISAMSAADYKRNLSNPEFVKAVNALRQPPKP